MTREDIEAQSWIGEQRAAVVALLDRTERAEAERDEALLNCKRINEEEFMKRVNGGNGSSLTPLGRMLTGLTAERDLLTAQLADVTRQRDECAAALRRWETVLAPWWDATRAEPSAPEQVAAALLAMREAFKRLADAVIESEDLHEANELGYDNPPYECQDGECSCELPNLINKTLANPTAGAAWLEAKLSEARREPDAAWLKLLGVERKDVGDRSEALAEHDAKVIGLCLDDVARLLGVPRDSAFGVMVDAARSRDRLRDRAEARRAALEEAAKVVSDCEVEGYEDRDRPTQVWHDSGHRTLMSAAAAVRALAPPAPAPSGSREDWGHGDGCGCARCMTSDAAKPVCGECRDSGVTVAGPNRNMRCSRGCSMPAAKAEPEPQCTGTLVHDAYSICPVHDAKPVCETCDGTKWKYDGEPCPDCAVTR